MNLSMIDIPGGSIGFMMLPQDPNLPERVRLWSSGMIIPGNRRWTVSGFRMSAFPITRKQWTEVMGTHPWPEFQDDPKDRDTELAHYPATCTSYDDITAFCAAISRKGKRYRLPTELEWEYAYRCGSDEHLYPWKSSDPQNEALANEYAVFNPRNMKQRDARLARVGSRKPNAFGLHDLVGLVSEFVLDRYHVHPESMKVLHGELPAEIQDALFSQGKCVTRKGGGFDESLLMGSYPHRVFAMTSDAMINSGFRVVEETPGWAPTLIESNHVDPPRRFTPQTEPSRRAERSGISGHRKRTGKRRQGEGLLKIVVKIRPLVADFPYSRFADWVDEQINEGEERYYPDPEVMRGTYAFYGTSIDGVDERFHSMQSEVFPFHFTVSAKPITQKTWQRLARENEWDLEEE
jgi:formylglycine-generating enzyme required for sulfatase activity